MSNKRHCPHCHCSTTIKFGIQNGVQRYRCKKCRAVWQNHKQPQRLYRKIQHDYFYKDVEIRQLCNKYNFGKDKIRQIINSYQASPIVPSGQHDVIGMDCTYFGRRGIDEWGLLIIVDLLTGECLYCEEIPGHETWAHYYQALQFLAQCDVKPKACVIDGVPGLASFLSYKGFYVQHCQFHQIKTINNYLTRNPILEPNVKLRQLVLSLTRTNRQSFINGFNNWWRKYHNWLNEKSRNPDTGKMEYTHQKTKSAVNSIRKNFPYLFTFEQHPELNIPNTNNQLEGINSSIKAKLNRHRGAKKELKTQLIKVFLSGSTEVDNN